MPDMKKLVKRFTPEPALYWWQMRDYRKNIKIKPEEYRAALTSWYEKTTGKALDLDNPKTLTEKIQWLKLWDSTEQKGILTDKRAVRSYIAEKIGAEHLIPLAYDGSWEQVDDIPLDKLPERFVLKLTTGSGKNMFAKEGFRPDVAQVRRFFSRPLTEDYAFMNGFELHYSFIKPAIIAEEYLDLPKEQELVDYRLFCSYGTVFSIWVDTGSWNHNYHRSVFDAEWNLVDVSATHPRHEVPPNRPALLEEMIEYASLLSREFALVRVDFYEYGEKVIFGEMTFTPQSGTMKFDNSDFDYIMGSYVRLPEEKKPFRGIML